MNFRRSTTAQGTLQGRQGQLGAERANRVSAAQTTGKDIQDNRQIDKPLLQLDVGDVSALYLVRTRDLIIWDQVGTTAITVSAVGRLDPSLDHSQQVIVSHNLYLPLPTSQQIHDHLESELSAETTSGLTPCEPSWTTLYHTHIP